MLDPSFVKILYLEMNNVTHNKMMHVVTFQLFCRIISLLLPPPCDVTFCPFLPRLIKWGVSLCLNPINDMDVWVCFYNLTLAMCDKFCPRETNWLMTFNTLFRMSWWTQCTVGHRETKHLGPAYTASQLTGQNIFII